MSENTIALGLIVLLIAGIIAIVMFRVTDKKAQERKRSDFNAALVRKQYQLNELNKQFQNSRGNLSLLFETYQQMVKYFFPYVAACKSVCADAYGVFRAKGNQYSETYQEGLKTITKDDIFLGNIYGLWTFPISKWEDGNIDKDSYKKVCDQFSGLLWSGIKFIQLELNRQLQNKNEFKHPKYAA